MDIYIGEKVKYLCGLGWELVKDRHMEEKGWYNFRLGKWIDRKYLNRTKYKEIVRRSGMRFSRCV